MTCSSHSGGKPWNVFVFGSYETWIFFVTLIGVDISDICGWFFFDNKLRKKPKLMFTLKNKMKEFCCFFVAIKSSNQVVLSASISNDDDRDDMIFTSITNENKLFIFLTLLQFNRMKFVIVLWIRMIFFLSIHWWFFLKQKEKYSPMNHHHHHRCNRYGRKKETIHGGGYGNLLQF